MAQNITSVSGRSRLKHRREPYWARLSKGRYLGFRPAAKGDGTWIARLADEATGKQRYQSLGTLDGVLPSDRYDTAAKEAGVWFLHVDGGGGGKEVKTVRQACEAYVQYLRAEPGKGDASADDAAGRFRRYVYSDAKLAECALVALKEARLLAWRNGLVETEGRSRCVQQREICMAGASESGPDVPSQVLADPVATACSSIFKTGVEHDGVVCSCFSSKCCI